MNLDLGSFAFGSYLVSGGGTPSWGTALGQSRPEYKFTYPGSEVVLIGMVYCSVPLDRVTLPLGKGGRIYKASELDECQLASMFRKVYVNGVRINYPFIMVLVKEDSNSHPGRKSIKYSDKNTYSYRTEQYSNSEFIQQVRNALGLSEDACWFVYSIEVYNQDEMHMSAVVVDKDSSIEYENSSERKYAWLDLIPATEVQHQSYKQSFESEYPFQQIFYGAPGTGKSHEVKRITKGKSIIRTTFHPDSDYSTFVGAYKPTMKSVADKYKAVAGKDEEITYEFVPQAFTKAYTAAWNTEDDVFLIIEEINRGNCAQIFGDLFQLLDRGSDGFSEYPVDADSDLADHIRKELSGTSRTDIPNEVKEGKKLVLPSNLFIWATMNTSDQSLFPIDSAFKRRWDWKYLSIENAGKDWKIKVNGNEYDWYMFIEGINKEVLELTHSEDKQLGYFFAKAKDGFIDAETLVNKVYFYLWTDVFKDYEYESQSAFRKPGSTEAIAFKDFFKNGKVEEEMAEQVLVNLGLYKLGEAAE